MTPRDSPSAPRVPVLGRIQASLSLAISSLAMPMQVLFLDVDGVICCNQQMRLEEVKMRRLTRICLKAGAAIVLSTNWRRIPNLRCHNPIPKPIPSDLLPTPSQPSQSHPIPIQSHPIASPSLPIPIQSHPIASDRIQSHVTPRHPMSPYVTPCHPMPPHRMSPAFS